MSGPETNTYDNSGVGGSHPDGHVAAILSESVLQKGFVDIMTHHHQTSFQSTASVNLASVNLPFFLEAYSTFSFVAINGGKPPRKA